MAPMWLIPALTYLCFIEGPCRVQHMKRLSIVDKIRHRMEHFIKVSTCTTPNGKSGVCRSIFDCPELRAIVNKPGMTADEISLLKRSACGFQGQTPKVCCPLQATAQMRERKSCVTPEGTSGQCISIFECKHIAERLQTPPVSPEYRAYVNSIRCPTDTGYEVCCAPPSANNGHSTTTTLEPVETGHCTSSATPPDPKTECCGLDGSSANKITGGNATAIDQYPWLALIEYKKDSKIKLLCGGVLISGRYALTAGHCVKGTVLQYGTPTNVRLGEYDTANQGRDCVPVEGGDVGVVDCTLEPIIIGIEEIIAHPEYNPRSSLRRHDIAMLRLADTAPYTDFVRPICLPTSDVTVNFPETARLFAAGWGAVDEKISSSNIKLHVDLPYTNMNTCQAAYRNPNRRVMLWDRQICAGGEKGKDSCKGDSGGPLMYSTGTTYEVVGIVSFGPTPCGLENIPGVYTKVFEYTSWIRQNIRP